MTVRVGARAPNGSTTGRSLDMADRAILPTSRRLVPPAPEPAPDGMGPFELARRMRTSGVTFYPHRAYEEEVVQQRYFGRALLILNAPDAIRQVLVDNHEHYERTRVGRRILRPLVGAGLLVSEGPDWRHQRRILAPAFTPKAVGLLAPHMLGPTEEVMTELRTARGEPVNLFATVQRLALEIAGRTMFSLEMHEHKAVLRTLVGRYNVRLARPHLLDVVLPANIPSPHDIARRLFSRSWMALFEALIARTASGGCGPGARSFRPALGGPRP